MIWLALPLTVWALVAAYAIWTWRDICLSTMREKQAEASRIEKSFERMQTLINRWGDIRATTTPSPAPKRSDNLVRPSFGQRKPEDDPKGAA